MSDSPRKRLKWWHYAIHFLLAVQLILFVATQFRTGGLGAIAWMLGSDRLLW